jgi:hypothetical protein
MVSLAAQGALQLPLAPPLLETATGVGAGAGVVGPLL